MNAVIRIPLQTTKEQALRLQYLQQGFAQLCNALAPLVQTTRIWNRVTLHHLAYRQLREQFPSMGSQMVCNAIYSVSRTCRMVFQHPRSPLNLDKLGERQLPLLRFADSCPVYFDRHTLSLKDGALSMFTLDGRMRFQLSLDSEVEARFQTQKLREVVLSREADGVFVLSFALVDSAAVAAIEGRTELPEPGGLPDYVIVDEVL